MWVFALFGFVVFYILYFSMHNYFRKYKEIFSAKTLGFVLLAGNLLIVASGMFISLFTLKASVGGELTEVQLNQISIWVNEYLALCYWLLGTFLAAIVLFIAQALLAIRTQRREEVKQVSKENRPMSSVIAGTVMTIAIIVGVILQLRKTKE